MPASGCAVLKRCCGQHQCGRYRDQKDSNRQAAREAHVKGTTLRRKSFNHLSAGRQNKLAIVSFFGANDNRCSSFWTAELEGLECVAISPASARVRLRPSASDHGGPRRSARESQTKAAVTCPALQLGAAMAALLVKGYGFLANAFSASLGATVSPDAALTIFLAANRRQRQSYETTSVRCWRAIKWPRSCRNCYLSRLAAVLLPR